MKSVYSGMVFLCIAIASLPNLAGQCGRCGDGGGTELPPGYVTKVGMRSVRASLDGLRGTILADVSELSQLKGVDRYRSVQCTLAFSGANNDAVEKLVLLRDDPRDPSGILVADFTPNLAALTLEGTGTAIRQATSQEPLDVKESLYRVEIKLKGVNTAIKLDLLPTKSEFVAIAQLKPLDGAVVEGVGHEGTGVFTATYTQNQNGIASAVVRFEFQHRYFLPNLGTTASIQKIGIRTGSRRSGTPAGEYLIDARLSNRLPVPQANGVLSYERQLTNASDGGEIRGLEALIRDPAGYSFDVDMEIPSQSIAGRLKQVSKQRVRLESDVVNTKRAADAMIEFYVLRSVDGGVIQGGYASVDWLYRGFTGSPKFDRIELFAADAKPVKELDLSVNGEWKFSDRLNDLEARNEIGGLSMKLPLLDDSPLLRVLTAAVPNLAGFLITDVDKVSFKSAAPEGLDAGPFIDRIEPPITTPGSLIKIIGGGFSDRPRVVVGGFEVVELRRLNPGNDAEYVARMAPDVSTLPNNERPVVLVDSLGRTSNNYLIRVDIVEPFIFTDRGPAVTGVATPTKAPSKEAPLREGERAEIRCTGFTANPISPLDVVPGLSAEVTIGGQPGLNVSVVQDSNSLGTWKVQFTIPKNLPTTGEVKVQIVGIWADPDKTNPKEFRFPSNEVDVWVER